MREIIFVLTILSFGVVVLGYGYAEKIISQGRWFVEKIGKCEDDENYLYDFNLSKKKFNRTHDVFDGEIGLPDNFTEDDFAIFIDACKKVDGGCKSVMTMEDDSACRFIAKHAQENFKRLLKSIGVEDHCPIPKGEYKVDGFMFDNTELPEDGMMGRFMAKIVVTKNTKQKEKVACVALHIEFIEKDDCDDDDE